MDWIAASICSKQAGQNSGRQLNLTLRARANPTLGCSRHPGLTHEVRFEQGFELWVRTILEIERDPRQFIHLKIGARNRGLRTGKHLVHSLIEFVGDTNVVHGDSSACLASFVAL